MLLIIWSVVLISAAVLYLRQVYSLFSRHGVKCDPIIPLLGNMGQVLLRRKHFTELLDDIYKKYSKERFIGRFEFLNPLLIINDLELVKKIAVKDYEYFLDHRIFLDEDIDPLFGRNLITLRGQRWKDMRSTLSPAFTSSKIRLMVPFMVEVGDQMVLNLKKQIKESESPHIDVEVKDLTTRYANDVIASCAFGLKVDSHTDKNNEFYKQGLTASTFKFKHIMVFFMSAASPWLTKALKLSLFSETTKNFFRNLVLDTMKYREQKNLIRPDMIHLLMEAKKGQLTHEDKADTDAGFATVEESSVGKKVVNTSTWTDDDLIAQAVLFFIAGFETVSSAMVFFLYEMALNPDAQDKLYQEIKEHDSKNNGKFDYNSIQNMTYLDMVVCEVLRLWSPAIALDRLCIKDYNLGKASENATKDFIVKKGMGVQLPTWCIHRDPQYFPNPTKFDPQRFSEENKHNIRPYSYMPFGLGPRNCIGSRFALCEMKVMAYQLLQHIEVVPGPKTLIPVVMDTDTFNLRMKGGHWLRFKSRS